MGIKYKPSPWTNICQQDTAKKSSNYATIWMLNLHTMTCRHNDASILRSWSLIGFAGKIILVACGF